MRLLIILFFTLLPVQVLACPMPTGTGANDMVVRFAAPSGGHAGSVTSGSLGGTATEGTLIYDTSTKNLKLCNGNTWVTMGSSSAPSQSIIDQYAAVLSITIPPVAGLEKWPDYIICNVNTYNRPFILPFLEYAQGQALYYVTSEFWYRFTDNGLYKDKASGMTTSCGAPAGDIVSICNDGRCGFY